MLDIKEDKINVLLGLNGSGKSTLLKSIYQKGNSFYLPPDIYYDPLITIKEYFKTITNEDNFEKSLKQVDLNKSLDFKIKNLSTGEFQRLNIAIALNSKAKILLLDEPTSNIDLVSQVNLLELVKSIKITTLIVLHDLELAKGYGDYFIGLIDNEIISDNKENFFKAKNLAKIFKVDEKYFSQYN